MSTCPSCSTTTGGGQRHRHLDDHDRRQRADAGGAGLARWQPMNVPYVNIGDWQPGR
jgi:hypothetical protein